MAERLNMTNEEIHKFDELKIKYFELASLLNEAALKITYLLDTYPKEAENATFSKEWYLHMKNKASEIGVSLPKILI